MGRAKRLMQMTAMAAALQCGAPAWAADDPLVGEDGMVTASPSRAGMSKTAQALVHGEDGASGIGDDIKTYLDGVHGEVSAMVDSRGGYNVSGTAVLPVGEDATVIVTLSQGRGPSAWRWGGEPYAVVPSPALPYRTVPRPWFGFR